MKGSQEGVTMQNAGKRTQVLVHLGPLTDQRALRETQKRNRVAREAAGRICSRRIKLNFIEDCV